MSTEYILVIGDNVLRTRRIQGMLNSYSTMNVHMVYSDQMPYISDDIETVIHIDSLEKIQATIHTMPFHVRYIGYVNGTDEIIGSANSMGYVGIPVPKQECPLPTSMYAVRFPHITLAPPMELMKLNQFKSLLGREIEYNLGEPVQQQSVIAHPALVKGEIHHVTRGVLHGEYPKRSIIEMEGVRADTYETQVGYPVIM